VIALSFALPEESKGLVRSLKETTRSGSAALPIISGTLAGRRIVVVHSGMGMASATERIGEFLDAHSPCALIASGFGGGLGVDLQIGDIVTSQNFSSPALLAAVASLPARTGSLVTTKKVIDTAEQKKDLARHTGAIVVDMETAAIHRLCNARSIPLLALRAISDTASQDLPVPAHIWFDSARQRPRPIRLVLHLATHPGRIAPFTRFVGGVNRARASLTAFLLSTLASLPDDPAEK
jgi:adenosylhomocysteine nucleosidase